MLQNFAWTNTLEKCAACRIFVIQKKGASILQKKQDMEHFLFHSISFTNKLFVFQVRSLSMIITFTFYIAKKLSWNKAKKGDMTLEA